MMYDFETKYQVGNVGMELIINYAYVAGRPATHEEPADPAEIDILSILYRFPHDTQYRTLESYEVLYQIILNDDDLNIDITDSHGPSVEWEPGDAD